MGVRLLQTYMERYVRYGVVDVDLKIEVDKFKSVNGGNEPLIVIDLLSISQLFYTSNHELILGARFNVYNERVVDLLGRIKSLGVKLVFFADGPTRDEKIETCLKRRNDEYTKAIRALNVVYSGVDLYEAMEEIEVKSPPPFFGNLVSLAKQFGDVHVAVQNECDVELAEYATRNNALAIISNDTDFLIFPGNWRYWSSRCFNVFQLKTVEFNREALRRTLVLKPDQMAILATMSGNDIVPYDDVKAYHRKIKNHHGGLHFRALASKIQSLRLSLSDISDEQVNLITDLIFARSKQELGRELVAISLKSYDYMKLNTDECTGFLPRVCKNGGSFNFIILANCKNIIQPHHFDFTKRDLNPFFDIISPLIRRIMGILLKNEEGNVCRVFYSKIEHEKEYEEIILEPDFPTCDLPPLENLLLDAEGKNGKLDATRIELICWQISSKLTPALLESLCPVNVSNSVTLLYLVELDQITIDEADCLLLACNCPSDIRDSLNLSDMRVINERDARIAFLFTTVRAYIKDCFDAVRWKKFDKLLCFDGLYFHTLRKTWDAKNKPELLKPYDKLRVYARL